jgi:ABC-type bacteriocin/lantibiotic exporter with double-glycine peptidase domain
MDMSALALILVLFLFALVLAMQFHLRKMNRKMNELIERKGKQEDSDLKDPSP